MEKIASRILLASILLIVVTAPILSIGANQSIQSIAAGILLVGVIGALIVYPILHSIHLFRMISKLITTVQKGIPKTPIA